MAAPFGEVSENMRDILLRGYQPWVEKNGETPNVGSTIKYLLEVRNGFLRAPLQNGLQQALVLDQIEALLDEQRFHILQEVLEEIAKG